MSKQTKGHDYHCCVPKTKVVFLGFNQPNDNILTLSNKRGMGVTTFLKRRLLRSFHTTQAHKSQMSCMKERLALLASVKRVNCNK